MEHTQIYRLFDNASVAAIISIVGGLFFARYIYREQKKIDKAIADEDKISETLVLLEEHCKGVNQIVDRLSNTYKTIIATADIEAQEKFIQVSLPFEIRAAVDILMYKIPEDISKIQSIVSLYYDSNKLVKDATQEVFDELKKWHDFVQLHATGKSGQKFDLNKRVSEVPEFSLEKLDNSIKKLILDLRK